MAKGLSIILTLSLLVASLVILGQYEISSMSSTAQGVDLSSAPVEVQNAYNASTHTTISAISVSHYTILLVAVFSVVLILVILITMVAKNRKSASKGW